MRHRLFAVAAAVVTAVAALAPAAAYAATTSPGSVQISPIPTLTATAHPHRLATATIRPQVQVSGHVQVRWKHIWIQHAGQMLLAGVPYGTATPAWYRVTTRVRYRTWHLVTRQLVLPAGTQASTGAYGNLVPRLGTCHIATVSDPQATSGTLTFSCPLTAWNETLQRVIQFPDITVPGTYKPGEYDPDATEFWYGTEFAGYVNTPADLLGATANKLSTVSLPTDMSASYQTRGYSRWHTKSLPQRLHIKAPR